jgi:N-acetylglucosamine-6-phosphate deacetylase
MEKDFILHVNSCFTPREEIHNASILCRDGKIMAFGGHSALPKIEGITQITLPNCKAIPGLIDTHLHGSGGFDAMDADTDDGIERMSAALARHGVTAFIPSVLSAPLPKMIRVLEALADCCEREYMGARPIGIHLEGPYLSVKKRGAQPAGFIRPVDINNARKLILAGKGKIRTMTFAPELHDCDLLINLLLEHNIVPSMGHSQADSKAALKAVAAGATRCTHLFNGMPLLDQRNASLTTIGLTDDRLTIELIVDGIHVNPHMIDIACRAKPHNRLVGISDATQGAGLPEGRYHLGTDEIIIADGQCRRVSDGRLAGSSLTLDRSLRNLINYSSMPVTEALACYTLNAAQSIGATDIGEIQPGKRADLVVVNEAWEVQLTIVNGRIVYDRQTMAQ